MARKPRQVSASGYYHVMLRGAGKRRLFEDDADRRVFLDCLAKAVERYGVTVLAWCLMDNHVHLILLDERGALSGAMASLETSYAKHVNEKTGSTGHVFENRFKSKAIEDEAYLLGALRYVHRNPVESGICDAANYPWSSYREYLGRSGGDGPVADTSIVLDILGGIGAFERLHVLEVDLGYTFEQRQRVNDEQAHGIAVELLGTKRLRGLSAEGREERAGALRSLHDAGLSVRQIQRVTGVGRWSVERALT